MEPLLFRTGILLAVIFQLKLASHHHLVSATSRQNWAVIVAGAKDYRNYFSQSQACHAYQTLRNGGLPEDHIILLSYDDVANHRLNPHPGNLITYVGGPNVYKGCRVDYRGKEVGIKVFLNVLMGNADAVKALIGRSGKVINSGPRDHIFIYMVDHGGPGGMFYFPDMVPLFAEDLIDTIVSMRREKKFEKMVLYVEACYAGAIFKDLLPDNIGVYAMTFANATEDSFKCCYDKVRNAYVGSVSGNAWMLQADSSDKRRLTFHDQLLLEKKFCQETSTKRMSHPQEFGDVSMNSLPISEFMGSESPTESAEKKTEQMSSFMKSAQVSATSASEWGLSGFLQFPPTDKGHLATLLRLLGSPETAMSSREILWTELREIFYVKKLIDDLTKLVVLETVKHIGYDQISTLLHGRQVLKNRKCYKTAVNHLKGRCFVINSHKFPFARRTFQGLINLCNICNSSSVIYQSINFATTQVSDCKVTSSTSSSSLVVSSSLSSAASSSSPSPFSSPVTAAP